MPAIFVHGVPDTHHVWDALLPHLSRDDVSAVDLPGFSSPVPDGWSATKEEYVDWLVAEVEKADEPVDIVGHDWGGARVAARRALDLNPNSVAVCWMAGWVIMFDGEVDDALAIVERSLRLSPSDPQVPFLLNAIGMCRLMQGRPNEALDAALRAEALVPDVDVMYYIIVPAAALLGRTEEVERSKAKLLALAPDITVTSFERRMPFRRRDHLDILLDGLRKAGLPE